ncbi:hypothetical protein CC79DRAFT_1318147 [Sarocladium strictum]
MPHAASGKLSPLTADGRTSSSIGGQAQAQQDAQYAFSNQLNMNHSSGAGRPNAYNMMSMANALPGSPYRGSQQPQGSHARYQHQAGSPSMMQQMAQMGQYGEQQSMGMSDQNFYGGQQHIPYFAGQNHSPHAPGNMQGRQHVQYYHSQVAMSPPSAGYYYSQGGQFSGQNHGMMGQMGGHFGAQGSANFDPRYGSSVMDTQTPMMAPQTHASPSQPPDGRPSAVRGPPRKPRQSGHAIWIGNLPPQTDLMSLVHHVCREAPGLQSLFLISKSNCAFANYKDEPSCATAQQKIHDSKFHSVRLVSRLRKSTVESASGATAPTGPASINPTPLSPSGESVENNTSSETQVNPSDATTLPGSAGSGTPQHDKFFILKSLTIEDLELSVRTGIWATQAHNEESLNGAFKAVENVYLVFSANKSGEYFGYAKMLSEINKDPAAAIEFAPTTQASTDVDLPKAIPTEVTEFAPRGKIIDDSARGTIFWEVDVEASDDESDAASETSSQPNDTTDEGGKTWGKPFKLEWLSTNRLPFYRTRGLRNPWNSNREVKIARDGTELEPSVGRRLIGLFNRIQSPGPVGGVARAPMGQMAPGYPPMRPHGH